MNKPKLDLMYILPNLFTAASIFFAMLSIFASINERFVAALVLIIISLVCDGLDGRVARAISRTSSFGVEFDSLADIVAFGVAPALLFYFAIGAEFGRLGQIAASVFVIFGAVRLARFNVTTGTYEPSVFIGLPIPTAAVVLALWTVLIKIHALEDTALAYIALALTFLLGFLMVSNIRYPSFKKLNINRNFVMKILILAIFVCSLIYLYPVVISTAIASIYVIYGIARALYNLISKNSYLKR